MHAPSDSRPPQAAPSRTAPEDAIGSPRDTAHAIAEVSAHARPATLVYVEDEPINVLLMQELLRTVPPWTLHVANDGLSGLELVRQLRPDLVMTDINLPGLDGFGLLERLRADPELRDLPCLVLSADAQELQLQRAQEAGFDAVLTKPVDLGRLLRCIEEQLARTQTLVMPLDESR